MSAKRKKVKRFVIDVNTYITIFINGQTHWLQDYIIQNSLEIFIDSHLFEELVRVLDYDRIKKHLPLDRVSYLTFIRSISTLINSEDFQIKSPDPEDNYLYNLALTANAKLLVTGENALLQWKEAPVETINLTTFRQLF